MAEQVVRWATVEDGPAIGRVHVGAWQAAYRHQMPDDYLASLDPVERGRLWTENLRRGGGKGRGITANGETSITLVAEDEGKIVGIASAGRARSSEEENLGELMMINLVPEAWGRGIGRLLLDAAMSEVKTQGYGEAILWVLDTNVRAQRFYEKLGWCADGHERTTEDRGFVIRDLRYRRTL
jgi:GNAT superfamily N-acetyltransferase